MSNFENVKIRKEYVDMLRKRKKNIGVPIATSVEFAISNTYGEPEITNRKSKQSKKNELR